MNAPSNALALQQAEGAVRRVLDHVGRVLRKYPRETVVPVDMLDACIWAYSGMSVASKTSGASPLPQDVVVTVAREYHRTLTVSFPLRLLDAPEQDIHVWARALYWRGQVETKRKRAAAAADLFAKRQRAVANAQRQLDAARAALARLKG